jgi:hypothetical protein
MASRSLGTLTIDLIAKVGGFVSGMSEAERQADRASKRIKKELATALDSTATSFAAVGAAALATASTLAAVAVSSIKATAEQIDLARALGATQAELAGMERAAALSGVSADELGLAAKRMNNTIGEAQAGSTAAKDALARLGLTAQELTALPISERMQVIAESISGLSTQTERAAAAQDIFGRGGQVLLPLLEEGAVAFETGAREARDFGLALNEIDAAAVADADDRMNSMVAALAGIKTQFGVAMAPLISEFADELLGAGLRADEFRDKFVAAFYASAKVVAFLGDIVQALTIPFRAVWVLVKTLETSIHGLAKAGTLLGLALTPKDEKLKADLVAITKNYDQARAELGEAMAGLIDTSTQSYLDDVDTFFAKVRARVAKQGGMAPPEPTGGVDPLASEAEEKARAAAEKAAEAKDKELRDAVARLDEQFQSEEQKLGAKYVNEQVMLEEALAAQQVTQDEYQRLSLESRNAYEQQLDELKFSKMDEGVQNLRDSFLSETQALGVKYVEEQKLLQEALESNRIMEDEYNQLALESKMAYESAVTRIEQEEADKRKKKAQEERDFKMSMLGDTLGNLSTLMNAGSRKLFEIGKAAALGQAIVNVAQGVTRALAEGGPFLGPALAASIAAAGLVQIQAIRSQQFGGGGTVSTPSAAGVSNTQAVNAATTQVSPVAEQSRRNVFFHGIDPKGLYSGQQMLEAINEAIANGGVLRESYV